MLPRRPHPTGSETTRTFDTSGGYLTNLTIASNDTSLAATTDIAYDSSGRRKAVVAPGTDGLPDSNRTAEIFYSVCCGQTVGAKNALGHGQIQSSNASGQSVHSVLVSDYTSHTSLLDPLDAKTLSESTTRYFDNGRVQYQTRWKVALDEDINRNLPQIAGLSKPASSGLTTQYVYDLQVGDGLGAEATGGVSVNRVTTSGTATVSIAAAVTQLGDTVANGGASVSLASHYGSATISISPRRKNHVGFDCGCVRAHSDECNHDRSCCNDAQPIG